MVFEALALFLTAQIDQSTATAAAVDFARRVSSVYEGRMAVHPLNKIAAEPWGDNFIVPTDLGRCFVSGKTGRVYSFDAVENGQDRYPAEGGKRLSEDEARISSATYLSAIGILAPEGLERRDRNSEEFFFAGPARLGTTPVEDSELEVGLGAYSGQLSHFLASYSNATGVMPAPIGPREPSLDPEKADRLASEFCEEQDLTGVEFLEPATLCWFTAHSSRNARYSTAAVEVAGDFDSAQCRLAFVVVTQSWVGAKATPVRRRIYLSASSGAIWQWSKWEPDGLGQGKGGPLSSDPCTFLIGDKRITSRLTRLSPRTVVSFSRRISIVVNGTSIEAAWNSEKQIVGFGGAYFRPARDLAIEIDRRAFGTRPIAVGK
jgi:hypothetical protein